jgi:hypothetical protein
MAWRTNAAALKVGMTTLTIGFIGDVMSRTAAAASQAGRQLASARLL